MRLVLHGQIPSYDYFPVRDSETWLSPGWQSRTWISVRRWRLRRPLAVASGPDPASVKSRHVQPGLDRSVCNASFLSGKFGDNRLTRKKESTCAILSYTL